MLDYLIEIIIHTNDALVVIVAENIVLAYSLLLSFLLFIDFNEKL